MTKKQIRYTESHARSILKAFTWRAMGTLVTFLAAWVISREFSLAAKLGLADTVLKIAAMYLYERLWNRISYGRTQHGPEYEI